MKKKLFIVISTLIIIFLLIIIFINKVDVSSGLREFADKSNNTGTFEDLKNSNSVITDSVSEENEFEWSYANSEFQFDLDLLEKDMYSYLCSLALNTKVELKDKNVIIERTDDLEYFSFSAEDGDFIIKYNIYYNVDNNELYIYAYKE